MDDSGALWPIDTLPTDDSYGPPAPAGPEHGVYPPLRPMLALEAQAGRQPVVAGPAEHPSYEPSRPIHDVYAPPRPMPRPGPWPTPGVPMHQQAVGSDGASSSSLGLTLLALAVGVGVGAKNGGLPGAAAGGLLAGSAVNVVRAFRAARQGTNEGSREVRVATFYGLIGAVGGGWLWVKYAHKRPLWPFAKNGDDDSADAADAAWRQDKIRRVGP